MSQPARVGIFFSIAIAIFVLGFYFLKGINLFERKNVYYAVYDRVDGLYKSNIVEVNGFPVGRVADMQRDPETGKIVVELDLDKNVKVPDSDSTVAQLVSTDLLGSKKVRLVFGSSNNYFEEGDTINTKFQKDFAEQLGAQIDPIMVDVHRMVPQLDTAITRIKYLFDTRNPAGIYVTLNEVNMALQKVNVILASNEANLQQTFENLESITSNIEKNNADITKLLNNLGNLSDSLQQANIKQTVENLNQVALELKGVMAQINSGHGTLGKVIREEGLYAKVDSAVTNMNALMKDVKDRPYRYISINVLGAKKAEERREQKYNESEKGGK